MRFALLPLTLAVAVTLSACAPVDTGNKQCSDVNINLAAAKDAKYTNLPQNEGGLSAAQIAAMDTAVTTFMQSKAVPIAGCAVGVTRNDQIAILRGYGVADTTTHRPFDYATPSLIGSISKTLTALAALRMEHDGLLLGTEPAYATLGAAPPPLGDPTLDQLLEHRSGINEKGKTIFTGPFNTLATINAFYSGSGIAWPSLRPALVFAGYKDNGGLQVNAPNVSAKYSNVGYMIAGAVIDQRSRAGDVPAAQRGYERYVWSKVARGTSSAEPTMATACLDTSFRQGSIKNLAHGYDVNGNPNDLADTGTGWGWEGPPGGWSMTIGDLARLALILQSDAVIPKATIDSRMRVSYGLLDDRRIGMGLELSPVGDPMWFGKGGDIAGFTADMKIWPGTGGDRWGVVWMCNQAGADPYKNFAISVHDAIAGGGPGGIGGIGNTSTSGRSTSRATPTPPADDALISIAKAYEPMLRRYATSYLADAGGSPERAWALARRELLSLGNGSTVVAALERGDVVGAVRLLPTLRWADGSPVTP